MKFLLTSGGISNASLEKALFELLGRPAHEVAVAFVPTAATPGAGDKSWLIKDLQYFVEQGFRSIDIVDMSAVPRENWLSRLETSDLICVGGGDEQYLAKMMRDTDLVAVLLELLKTRIYMGISAGSMVMGKLLSNELTKELWPEESFVGNEEGMGFFDVSILPHMNSQYFAHLRPERIQSLASRFPRTIYALDDYAALKIIDGEIEVVGEGEFLKLER